MLILDESGRELRDDEPTIIFEAQVIDPGSGEVITVRALSIAELEAEIDLAFGVIVDQYGCEIGLAA